MNIFLSTESVDLQECDILATGFFEDERPLKGSSGWIDWRLNGRISHFLIKDKFIGYWKEKILIPSNRRLGSQMILLFGFGKLKDYSYLRLREFSSYLFETLKKMKVSSICLSLPSEEQYNVNCGKSAEVIIEGIADCFDTAPSSHEEWGKDFKLFFSVEEEKFPEILLGVQTAQSVLKDRLKMRIFTRSEQG
jgi:hypothetical protein